MKALKFPLHFVFALGLVALQACSNISLVQEENVSRLPAQENGNLCTDIVSNFFDSPKLRNRSFLYGNLLKYSHLNEESVVPVDDLNPKRIAKIQLFFKDMNLSEMTPLSMRFNLLKKFPLGDIAAAPGHRYLRKPEQIKGLIDYIAKTPDADFGGDKIILNVVADTNGKIESVDLWNAHHRIVSYLENGYLNIGDIPEGNIEILVNGKRENGEAWTHYLPSAGVDWRNVSNYTEVPPGGDIREGTIAVPGNISNFHLGARNTLSQLHKNVFNSKRKKMKVGVYFGTFDPIHEGHVGIIKKSIEALGLDEVIIVPNVNPIHKQPTAIEHRNAMISIRIKDEKKINLYTGNSGEIIDRFGRNPFFERMIQIYGSTELFQIIGDDSFEKLLKQGDIEKSNFRKYVVFRRKDSKIALTNSEKAIVIESEDEAGLSSTVIRKKIKSGEDPKGDISPDEHQYILQNNLYKD